MSSQSDELIEQALATYPLAQVPPDLSRRIMRRVQALPASSRFRLTWIDYALGLFVTMLPAAGFIAWALMPRDVLLELQIQWQLFQSSSLEPVIVVSLAAAGVLLLLAFMFSLGLWLRPGRMAGR